MSDRKRNSYHRDEHNRVSDSNRCRIPDSSSRDSGTKRKAQSELASDGKRTRMTMDVNAIREQQRLLKQQQEQQKQQQKQTQQSNVSQKPDGIQIDGITRIRKFDMRRINIDVDGQRILIVGQSGSGKSSITLEIMRYNKDIPVWMIVSPTEKMNQTYTPFIHPACIHDELDLASLRRFKKRQEDRCSKWRVPGSTKPFKYRRNPSGAVILDDVIVSAKLFKDEIFRWAYFNSRHAKTLWIQLTQYAMLIPSDHRRNIKYLILFQQSSNTEIKKLFYEFGGAFTKLSDFNRTLKLCTQNFGGKYTFVCSILIIYY